jgi:hypothetical protein
MDKVEKGLSAMYWIRQGCIMLGVNLLLAGFFLWGVYAAFTAYRLETNGAVTEGVVIEMDESTTDGSTTYSPIIEYQVNGQTYTFDGGISSNPPQYHVGERVSVRYDKADPSTAQIDKWSERWLMPVILIPAMCFTALLVNGFAFFAWRKGRDAFE